MTKPPEPSVLVSAGELGKWVNLTARRAQQLAKEGLFGKAAHGKYDLRKCVKAYVKHLQDRLHGKRDESDVLMRARERLVSAQADKEEMEVARMKGELIAAEEMRAAVGDMVNNCRARLLAVPSKLAPALKRMETPQDVERCLADAVREALDELKEYPAKAD
jgi:phage terminase Nu1 subunit (DNA packaging protein)